MPAHSPLYLTTSTARRRRRQHEIGKWLVRRLLSYRARLASSGRRCPISSLAPALPVPLSLSRLPRDGLGTSCECEREGDGPPAAAHPLLPRPPQVASERGEGRREGGGAAAAGIHSPGEITRRRENGSLLHLRPSERGEDERGASSSFRSSISLYTGFSLPDLDRDSSRFTGSCVATVAMVQSFAHRASLSQA